MGSRAKLVATLKLYVFARRKLHSVRALPPAPTMWDVCAGNLIQKADVKKPGRLGLSGF
jgi:hypothetical protein